MKVGIVTMHRVDNYGAALQAYATCESIRFLGGTPEIIDYIPNRFRLSRQLLNVRADRAKTILHKALFIVASAPIRLKIWHSFTSLVNTQDIQKLLLTRSNLQLRRYLFPRANSPSREEKLLQLRLKRKPELLRGNPATLKL